MINYGEACTLHAADILDPTVVSRRNSFIDNQPQNNHTDVPNRLRTNM